MSLFRTTILVASIAGLMSTAAEPAFAINFNDPPEKRAYCQVYAQQAQDDVHAGQIKGCGLTGASWSGDFDSQFNWCMAQGDMSATTQLATARSNALQQCSGSGEANFPPVVDAPPETASTFPPVIEDTPVASSSEPETAAAPSMAEEAPPARTASAAFPPVADASAPAADPGTDVSSQASDLILSHQEEARQLAERLIEFGQEHKDEIRHAAHKMKEKIKEKLSDLKRHRHRDGAGQTLRAKVKDALKGALMRRLANR